MGGTKYQYRYISHHFLIPAPSPIYSITVLAAVSHTIESKVEERCCICCAGLSLRYEEYQHQCINPLPQHGGRFTVGVVILQSRSSGKDVILSPAQVTLLSQQWLIVFICFNYQQEQAPKLVGRENCRASLQKHSSRMWVMGSEIKYLKVSASSKAGTLTNLHKQGQRRMSHTVWLLNSASAECFYIMQSDTLTYKMGCQEESHTNKPFFTVAEKIWWENILLPVLHKHPFIE